MKLAIAVSLALCAVPEAAAPDERASYEQELARLRAESEKELAQIRAETTALESKVDLLRRVVPAQFEADSIEQRLHILAKAGEMRPLEVKRVDGSQKVQLSDGRATPYERFFIDVAGQDPYPTVAYFLDRVSRLPALVELASLSLDAAPGGTVRFAARFAFPCYAGWPEATPAAAPVRPRPLAAGSAAGDERSAREQSLREQRLFYQRLAETAREPLRRLQAEVIAMAEIEAAGSPTRLVAALTRLEAETGRQLVALSRTRLDSRVVVEGVVVGAAAHAGLRLAFDKAGFDVIAQEVALAGVCRAFTLEARLKPTEEPTGPGAPLVAVGLSPFRHAAASACGPKDQAHKGNVAARGAGGNVTVRLRDTDLADVFNVLATVTQAAFVIDADVKGRVDVEFDAATLDEALAAMKAAGVTVGPGPLRRVSMAGTAPPPVAPASRAEPVSLFLKDGVLIDVVRLFEDISGRAAWTAPVVNGRVTVFAPEVPWDVALHGIAASAGLKAVIEPVRFFVGPAAMAGSPWKSGAVEVSRANTEDGDSGWARVTDIARLAPEDLALVGHARTAVGVKAVAYGPGRLLWVLEPGAELFEARVHAVAPTAVTFALQDGRKTEVRLTP